LATDNRTAESADDMFNFWQFRHSTKKMRGQAHLPDL